MVTPTIETVQQYWDARPCNIRHSPRKVGTREFFDEVEQRKYFVEPHIPAFADFARWKGKKVLEIGCGIGTDAVNFARSGAEYHGVDLSNMSLDIAKQRFAVYGLDGNFYHGNAEEVDRIVPDQKYDLVYSFGVIHHTPNPRDVVRAVRRLMTRESDFRFMVYAKDSWKNIMIGAGLDQPEAQSGCPIARTYNLDDILDLLAFTGITPTSLTQDHIFPFVVEKYIRYEYEVAPWFAAMPKAMFDALQKRMGWHLLVTAALV